MSDSNDEEKSFGIDIGGTNHDDNKDPNKGMAKHFRSLDIVPFPTKKSKIKLRKWMEEGIIPKFGSPMMIISGSSGSGKTTLLRRLMTDPNMFGPAGKDGFFDFVFLLSTTGKIDDLQKKLGVKKKYIIDKEKEMIETIDKIMKIQQDNVKSDGIDKAPKIALIFEDLTSMKKLLKSEQLLRLAVQSRHLNIFPICCVHKYVALPRTIRLQAGSLFFFQGQRSEMERISEEFGGGSLKKKEMMALIDYATSGSHSFLFIDTTKPFKERFKKNLTELLRIG